MEHLKKFNSFEGVADPQGESLFGFIFELVGGATGFQFNFGARFRSSFIGGTFAFGVG